MATENARRVPDGLAPLQLQQTSQGVTVNRALQTSIPYIYACGSLIGGYSLPSVADYEAKLAVQNALFEGRSPVQYHQVPYAILSTPSLARVGLTEQQARRHDPQVQVLQQTYQNCDRILFQQAPASLCKVLVQPNGTLLGAHILGSASAEIIHVLALAIQQGVRLPALSSLSYVSPTFTQIIQSMANQWQQQRYDRDHNERWFYKRRQQTR